MADPSSALTQVGIAHLPYVNAATIPVDGDVWATPAGVFARINGATIQLSGGGTPGGTNGQIQYNNAGAFGGLTVGTGLTVVGGSLNVIIGTALGSVATMVDLVAFDPVASGALNGAVIYMAGYYTNSDGGEGVFVYNSTSTATANAGTIVSPASGVGRWFRLLDNGGNRGIFNVRWYGAKGTGIVGDATTNTTAINFAIADCIAWKPATSVIPKVYFPAATYYTNGHALNYFDAEIMGDGSGMTRIVHAPGAGNNKPIFYFYGGVYQTAAPYGGCHGVSLLAGANTFPANIYWDACIDNQINMDDLGVSGSQATANPTCDGLGLFDFLNFKMEKFRCDGIGGYGIRLRGSMGGAAARAASAASGPSSYRCNNAAVDTTTGRFVTTSLNAVPPLGSGVYLFTSGTFPTPNSGAALVNAGGETYFTGPGSTEAGVILHRTRADALAGTNPITFSATNTGGLSLCVFLTTTGVTAVTPGTDQFTHTCDKNIIIPTSTVESGRTTTYGSGYTGTFNAGGAGALGGLKYVFIHTDGTYPTGVSPGTPYYPIYVDAYNFKIASSVSNAAAGIAIDLIDSGTGNFSVMYDSGLSQLGLGGFYVKAWTYDNSGAPTSQTVNGTACGGRGIIYANYSQFSNKGPITIEGHRIELNKTLAVDTTLGKGRVMCRIETGIGNRTTAGGGGPGPIQFSINSMAFDASGAQQGSMHRIIGNSGNTDINPTINDCQSFNFGQFYNNDNGTAFSMTPQVANTSRMMAAKYTGDQVQQATVGLLSGAVYNAVQGRQTGPYSSGQTGSLLKGSDVLYSTETNNAFYKVVQTTVGWTKGTGSTSTGITVTGTVANGAVFTISGVTPAGVGLGSAVSIAGAGAAGVALTGIIGDFDNLSATRTMTLYDPTTGLPSPCLTDVTGAAMTFLGSNIGRVPLWYEVSGSLAFGTVNAGTQGSLTINAPTGTTFTVGKPVVLGFSSKPAGITYSSFVTAGGASITVLADNPTAGNIAVSTQTFTGLVRA